ncbi:MAG: type VI secretion system protein TssA [Marinibacterium sp.]
MPIVARNHSHEAPSGENLEYEPVFTALTLAAQPEEERQAGSEIIPGAEPDAKKILECAQAVIEQSNDIRAAVHYAYAATRSSGFAGLAEATTYIRACLEDFWDSVHPQLDEDDDDDPTMRINSILGLVDPATVLRATRLAPLTQSNAFGRLSLRDVAIVEGEITVPDDVENPPTAQMLSAAFQDSPADDLAAIADAVRTASEDIDAINAVFDERLPGQGPNLDALAALLKKAGSALAPYLGGSDAVGEDADAPGDDMPAEGRAAAAPKQTGAIESPADVEKALDRIIDYYLKSEPSSPLPLLLMRAKRLIGADFMTILRDMAPQGMENAQLISGETDNPE